MTEQEAFEKALRGVVAQGVPSVNDTGSCVYRGPGSLKCGVGHLLTDEEAKRLDRRDDPSISTVLKRGHKPASLDGLSADFLDALQRAHDNSGGSRKFVEQYKRRMAEVATRFNLYMPVDML